ncbi:hypothetical protein Cpir12675_006339 [Ceratocystis pirilliformis]|uniref:PLD phosphodiesterase domain-containing protein n=1 Tax=Ceratocystis pirilliformis TaxID=259994 RepID=A0ABR3YIZ0_9PEZI
MDAPQLPSSFLSAWSAALADQQMAQRNDFPSYHIADPVSALVASCQPRTITTGTGASIFKETLLPALSQARREIILVTCFWAESETLKSLRETLENMAARREAERTRWGAAQRQNPENRLRISLCFSSSGVLQKLLHPQSTRGRVYQPKEWQGLGLPSADTLSRGGIDLTVKSLFFLPFSVMHPKFLLVDRERAWMPSCNISWESWFETCIEFEGPAVGALLAFHESVWHIHNTGDYKDIQDVDETNGHVNTRDSDQFLPPGPIEHRNSATGAGVENMTSQYESLTLVTPAQNRFDFAPSTSCPAVILPSSHHINPHFRLIPYTAGAPPPPTPLNVALLTLFSNAQKHIEIMTPNLTSDPAIEALLDALQRGVDVTLRTSRNMMTVEQLVTAGTTTAWKLKAMVARYRKMQSQRAHAQRGGPLNDVESQQTSGLGKLEIYYYKANKYALTQPGASLDEPVLAHAKVVLVDNEYMILGSGNMDRASWFTSQELGILLYMPGFSSDVWRTPLESRQECIWESGTE